MNTATNLAFTLANGLATQLITLTLAMIGLSVTFAKDFQGNTRATRVLLILTGITFFVSIIFGIMKIKSLITIVPPSKSSNTSVMFSSDSSLWFASWQEYLFYAGLILFLAQGVVGAMRRSP